MCEEKELGSFENVIDEMCLEIINLIYTSMY